MAKSAGRKAKNAAQSGARKVSNAASRARSASPSFRPRSSPSGGASSSGQNESFRDSRSERSNDALSRRSDEESSQERMERKERRDFYENRQQNQTNKQRPAQRSPRSEQSPRSERPRSLDYWKSQGRYGYGLGWRTRYRWFPLLFTPSVYAVWYPHSRWEPYYILDDSYIQLYERDFTLPPNSAYRINPNVAWPQNLPPLPKFKEVGINLGVIRYQREQLSEEERANVMKVQHVINEKLAELKLRYNTYVNRGYWPVPDLDREQFSWVKVVS